MKEYEVIRPQFDLVNYVKNNLQHGSSYKHVPDIEDYWADYYTKVQTREKLWSRIFVEKIKLYKVNINMENIEDDGSNFRSSTYEKEIKDTPIVFNPLEGPTIDKMEILMDNIIKRIDKWVEWMTERRKRTRASGSST